MKTLGFVGVGAMGLPIATRLAESGADLRVFDLNLDAVAKLKASGATAAESLKDLSGQCELIFLSLPGPQEVEAVVADLLSASNPCGLIVDLSTNSVRVSKELGARCNEYGVGYLDAPVSGGTAGAQRGRLSTMVGSTAEDIERIRPYLETFCSDIFHVGATGAGTLAKLINNQIFLSASVLVQEAFVFADKAGLDSDVVTEILNKSSAGIFTRKAGFVLNRSFDQVAFKLGIARKDLELAVRSASELDVDLPMTSAALEAYREAGIAQLDEQNFTATLSVLEQAAGTNKAGD